MHRFTGLAQRIRQIPLRLLPGTQNHMIHAQQLRLAADRDVQPVVVDLLVAHRRDHLHPAREQGGAVDPAGGFPQPFARFAGLTLQHHDLARAFWQLRPFGAQAAGLAEAGINAPFDAKLSNVLAGRLARLAQIHRGIKADPAAADNRHLLANRYFVTQHVEIAQHFWMIDTLDRRRARYDPARQDHLIEISQIRCVDKLVKPQLDARQLDHPAVVAQRFVELLFAGDLFGDIKLPANLPQRIKQRHAVPARGGIDRKRQACRASTHDGQAFFIDRRNDRHFGFMAGAWVNQAGGDLPDEDLIQTGLITADAGVDLIRASALRFRQQLGIGEERARHRDHVGIAA